MMIRKILVPLDGSLVAEQGLATACRLARGTGATLVLVRAVMFKYQSDAHEALGYLGSIRQRLTANGLRVETEVLSGEPVYEIISAAAAHHADLISMATHGYSGLRRAVLGSVAEAVLSRSIIPVLVTHATHTPVESVPGPFRKILIPLDGTAVSEMALTYLKQEQLCAGADVVLLRVVEPGVRPQPAVLAYTDIPYYAEPDNTLMLQREQAEGYLCALGYALNARSRQALVTVGDSAQEIQAIAKIEAADLIVMVTHARHGIDWLAHGSVARELLHHTEIPVLLLPSIQRVALAPEELTAPTQAVPAQASREPIALGRRTYEGSAG